MKTWKLVSGILSIIATLILLPSSLLAGGFGKNDNNAVLQTLGDIYLILGIVCLVAGITSIATKNGGPKGDMVILILYGIGALVALPFGLINISVGGLAVVIGLWSLACAIAAWVSFKGKKKATEQTQQDAE